MNADSLPDSKARWLYRLAVAIMRWPLFVPLALVAAVAVWFVSEPWLAGRVLSFDVALDSAGRKWALEWQRRADGQVNGVWLDFGSFYPEPETLEIHCAGKTADSPGNAELWLYSATSLQPGRAPLDLKRAIRTASPADLQGHWIPFEAGPGIVYSDSAPGLLRLGVPSGGIVLHMARTATSGRAVISYADDTQQLDLYAPSTQPLQVVLSRRAVPAGQTVHVEQQLPQYELSGMTLRWLDSPGATIVLSRLTVEQRVFGIRARSRVLRVVSDGSGTPAADHAGRFDIPADAPAGVFVLAGDANLGRTARVVGIGVLFAGLLGLRLAGGAAVSLGRRVTSWGAVFDVLAASTVVAAHLGMAAWAPFLLSNDSIDYLGDSVALVETGGLAHFGSYRTPGYSIFIAPFLVLFHDFATALGYAQAVLGILSGYFVYRILKAFVPRPWPALGLLLVGLDPVLLTYERYALSECLTSFSVALAAWVLIWQYLRYRTAAPSVASVVIGGLVLGAICGLSAYVRPNLQMLVILIPLILVLVCWRAGVRPRLLLQTVITFVVALACVAPWAMRNHARFGRAALALGTQANRLGGIWNFGAMDTNQTAVFSYDRWQELRRRQALGQLSVYELVPEVVNSADVRKPAAPSEPAMYEEVYRRVACEATARRPAKVVGSMGVALASQLGLWPKFDHPNAAENAAWSAVLRGEPGSGPTNFSFVPEQLPPWHRERILALAQRSQCDITYLRESPATRWFNELFLAYRQARPGIAILFLLGLVFSLAAQAWPLAGIGLIALANAVAMAVLVLSPIDRYSAPFQPLIGALAVYGVFRLISGLAARSAAPGQSRAARSIRHTSAVPITMAAPTYNSQ